MSPGRFVLTGAVLLAVAGGAMYGLRFWGWGAGGPRTDLPTSKPMRSTEPAATWPASATMPAGIRRRPESPAARQYVEQRERMVERQIAHPLDGRPPVKDARVLSAMRAVPRHAFVPTGVRRSAYEDNPLPIGEGQTISQPYIVALMTELLRLGPDAKVLEIGTGSGYQAAVLAHLTPHVYTIEILAPLAETAGRVLKEQGYSEVHCRTGDGYKGWPEAAPFDAIIVTCSAEEVPQPLWDQLKPGGRMVIPAGAAWGDQELIVLTKTPEGQSQRESVAPVRFVPMLREGKH